jgi:citrate lyase synthetase
MSILTFFDNQRRRWFDHIGDYSTDYFAGAWAALLQAETIFRHTPLYNSHLEAQTLRGELNTAKLEVQKLRKQLEKAEPHYVTARSILRETNRVSQYDRRRDALSRRTMVRMEEVAGLEEFEPEVRLRYLQQIIQSHMALHQQENPDVRPQQAE